MTGRRWELRGTITSAGFASGDRFVVGRWEAGPIGPMVDVMWAQPSGRRVLLVPEERVGRFVEAVYRFDEVRVVPFEVGPPGERALDVTAGSLDLHLRAGYGRTIPLPAWPWATRWLAGPVARVVLGVRTYGASPSGVREWYRARRWHPVVAGWAALDGRDLGPLGPIRPAVGFGFSEPPARPSLVRVRPLLQDPSGRLDQVVADLAG